MAWLPVNIAMILGHQGLTLGEGSDPCNGLTSPCHSNPLPGDRARGWCNRLFTSAI
jgi:hypothetical protein